MYSKEVENGIRTVYMVFYSEFCRINDRYMLRRKYFDDIAKANKFALHKCGKIVCVNIHDKFGTIW